MYPLHVILTLIGMITAGAGRIVAVKIYFQMEVDESQPVTPLYVTLLYLVGQALSLVVYYGYNQFQRMCSDPGGAKYSTIEMADTSILEIDCISDDDENDNDPTNNTNTAPQHLPDNNALDNSNGHEFGKNGNSFDGSDEEEKTMTIDDDEYQDEEANIEYPPTSRTIPPPQRRILRRQGSKTGLTQESKDAIAWVHQIPWIFKPVIPGFFNLCNSALRWASLVYVAASTAEILISGMELVFSAIAARIIRKRIISNQRWMGIAIVTVGIFGVGLAKVVEKKDEANEEHQFFIGNVLILGQCLFSVLQDLSEEIFMQESNFPATLLLGLEGLFGLVFGAPLYFFFFEEDLSFSKFNIEYQFGLVVLVLITGILNIRTTEVTSSMTRNVWKQCRIMLVWILGLLIYYVGNNSSLGEPWVNPGSSFVLGGFMVILTGVYFYYSN